MRAPATRITTIHPGAGAAHRNRLPGVTIEIGGIPILLRTEDAAFRAMLERRYADFLHPSARPACQFEVRLRTHSRRTADAEPRVSGSAGRWRFEQGDFCAECNMETQRGWIRRPASPYSIDPVLRIAHSLLLAQKGGFLAHAAGALRDGRAFLFAGASGAGKTTIVRFAPADVTILADELSYVARGEPQPRSFDGQAHPYRIWSTPFSGESAPAAVNLSAPLDTLFFLARGPVNRIEPVGPLAAVRGLMRHILWFAHDAEAARQVFSAAVEFVSRVRIARLVFTPGERVWELVGCSPCI